MNSRSWRVIPKRRAFAIAWYAVMAVLAVPFLFPLWWMFTSSLKPSSEIFAFPPTLWPADPDLQAYADVFVLQPFARQYFNSLYIAILVTAGTLFVGALAGYGFARLRFPGQNIVFLVLVSALLLPNEVMIIPLFQMMESFGWVDTHLPLILIPMLGAQAVFATFVMRQYFLGFPAALEEAGRLDGLGRFGVFFRIAVPQARPVLAAVGILTFLKSWDMFLEPLVFLNSPELFTVPLAMTQFDDPFTGPVWNVQMAAATLATLPILIAYVVAQRQFVQGIANVGIKG